MKKRLILYASLISALFFSNTYAQTLTDKIRINQVGFFCDGGKKAIAVDFNDLKFELWKSDLSEKVYTGFLVKSNAWDQSGETNICIADFSDFKHEGTYVVVVGTNKSYSFIISPNALDTVAKAQMKYYYFNRSSIALPVQYAGKWARAAGHMNTQVTPLENQSRKIVMPGGWYDAGDYGLYMVTGSMAACQIMMSYEQFPDYWNKTQWNIPESGNDVPDILNEVKWELKWMYNMKDTDNGVWYKATSKSFPGFVMPNKETSPIYCMVKNATSAYDYAATFALAARLFKNYTTQYPGFSDSCLNAAKAAWIWGNSVDTTKPGCANPSGVVTGEYLDNIANDGNDNKALAGVEMFITTGDSSYVKPLLSTVRNGFINGEANWYEKRPVACMQLALHGDAIAKSNVLEFANSQVDFQNNNGYIVNIGNTKYDFNWGSNRRISNRAMAMLVAYILNGDTKYIHGVTNAMDYILGRNATGYCFISGLGTKQVLFPHHRISSADGVTEPTPGLPIQGSYYGIMGQCNPNIVSPFAAKNYIDNQCSYSTNELSIDQGSPNVFNLGGLMHFLGKPLNVEIVKPLPNQVFSKDSFITIIANVISPNSTIKRVDFYKNNQLLFSDGSSPYEYTLPPSATGETTISVRAFTTNNDSSVAQISIAIGNAAPHLKIIEPQNNALFSPGHQVQINVSAFDIDGGISKLEYYVNNALVHTSTDTPFVYTIPSIAAGTSQVKIIAYDTKNETAMQSISFSGICDNLVKNGKFNNDLQYWQIINTPPADSYTNIIQPGISAPNALDIQINNKGKNASQIQLKQLVPIKKGNTYYISYIAKADSTSIIECTIQHESDAWDPWVKYIACTDTIQTYPQQYFHSFTASDDDDSSKLKFFVGTVKLWNVYIDNIRVTMCPPIVETIAFVENPKTILPASEYFPPIVFKNSFGGEFDLFPMPKIAWSVSDSSIASINSTGNIKAKTLGKTNVTATLVSNYACKDVLNLTVSNVVGIPDNSERKTKVQPTITNNEISVISDEILSVVQIISSTGEILETISCNASQIPVSLANYTSGLYWLKVLTQSNNISIFKIVKN